MGKLTYYIDDLSDPAKIIGKHGFFDMEGNKYGHQAMFDEERKWATKQSSTLWILL